MLKMNLQYFGGSGSSLRSGGGVLTSNSYRGVTFEDEFSAHDRQTLQSAERLSGTTFASREEAIDEIATTYGLRRGSQDTKDVLTAGTTGEMTFRSDGSGGKFAVNGADVVGQYYKNVGSYNRSGYTAYIRVSGNSSAHATFRTATEAKEYVTNLLKQTNIRFRINE